MERSISSLGFLFISVSQLSGHYVDRCGTIIIIEISTKSRGSRDDEAIKSTETRIDDEAMKSTETRMHYM